MSIRLGWVLRALAEGAAVYALVAACSASDTAGRAQRPPQGIGGRASLGEQDGSTIDSDGSLAGTHSSDDPNDAGELLADVFDAFTDPVPDAAAEPSTSGSRLKKRYRVGDDGSKDYSVGVWYDSARNEDCSWNIAGDGKTRCTPSGPTGVIGYFADSGCSAQPLAYVPFTCATGVPTYFSEYSYSATCSGQAALKLYPVTAEFTGSKLYNGKPGACAEAARSATARYFNIGGEIAPSSFVASTLATAQ